MFLAEPEKTEIVPTTENNSSLTTIMMTHDHIRYKTYTVIELLLFNNQSNALSKTLILPLASKKQFQDSTP